MDADIHRHLVPSLIVIGLCVPLGGCATGVTDSDPGAPWILQLDGSGGNGAQAGAPGGNGGSGQGGIGGTWNPGGASPSGEMSCDGELTATVRDFQWAHPDFENYTGDGAFHGLVLDDLAADGTPAYAHPAGTPQTTGPGEFAQWYHDAAGVNEPLSVTIVLTETSPGVFVYDDAAFFPIDSQGFGDEGNPHNFHFTTEIHTSFLYEGGESFTFRGDDDLWLFINGRLAIDLGGLHPQLSETIDLDDRADELGIEPGQIYAMDIFHAERHTPESNFHLETTIGCFDPVPK